MKRAKIIYWISTGLLIPFLGAGSVMELAGNADAVNVITSLGYPAYLSPFLGLARLLALGAILTPGFLRLKEWAYAGLVFDVVGAMYSLLVTGKPATYIIFPVVILAIILASYLLHHRLQQLRMA